MAVNGDSTAVETTSPERLYEYMPRWVVVLVCTMLACALTLNIIALIPMVTFMEIRGLVMPGPYSILKVIEMLWNHGLYPLAVLVVVFSVLFPPIKVTLATKSIFRPMTLKGRQRLLGSLGQLGRWSLLDVFVALLLIIITSKQSLTNTTVSFGLYAFLGAIVLSMSSVAILQEVNRRQLLKSQLANVRTHSMPMLQTTKWRVWAVVPLLIVAIAALMLTVHLPLFQINKFGLMSNTWSLWGAIMELQHESLGLHLFSGVMFAYLVAAPALLVSIALLVLLLPLRQNRQRQLYITMHHVYEWCMLDVFVLALLLYLSEEKSFAELDLKIGAWFLFGSMALFHVVMFITVRTVRRETGMTHRG
jgi:paraquat-inducible protein A